MKNKFIAILLTILVISTVAIPFADESAAESDDRDIVLFGEYLLKVSYTTTKAVEPGFGKIFLNGSNNLSNFENALDKLKNGNLTPQEYYDLDDDSNLITDAGMDVIQYTHQNYTSTVPRADNYKEIKPDLTVFSPNTVVYYAEPGNTVSFVVTENPYVWYTTTTSITQGKYVQVDTEYTIYAEKSTYVSFFLQRGGDWFGTAHISISGINHASGSAIPLGIFCIVLTAAVAGVLVYAGFKPKW